MSVRRAEATRKSVNADKDGIEGPFRTFQTVWRFEMEVRIHFVSHLKRFAC